MNVCCKHLPVIKPSSKAAVILLAGALDAAQANAHQRRAGVAETGGIFNPFLNMFCHFQLPACFTQHSGRLLPILQLRRLQLCLAAQREGNTKVRKKPKEGDTNAILWLCECSKSGGAR